MLIFMDDVFPTRNFDVGLQSGTRLYKMSYYELRADPELLSIRKGAFPNVIFYIGSGLNDILTKEPLDTFDWSKYYADYITFLKENTGLYEVCEAFLPAGHSIGTVNASLYYFEHVFSGALVAWPVPQDLSTDYIKGRYLITVDSSQFQSFPFDFVEKVSLEGNSRVHVSGVGTRLDGFNKLTNLWSVDTSGWCFPTRYSTMPVWHNDTWKNIKLDELKKASWFSQYVVDAGYDPAAFEDPDLKDTRFSQSGLEVTKWHTLSAVAQWAINRYKVKTDSIPNYVLRFPTTDVKGLELIKPEIKELYESLDSSVPTDDKTFADLSWLHNSSKEDIFLSATSAADMMESIFNVSVVVDSLEAAEDIKRMSMALLVKRSQIPLPRDSSTSDYTLGRYARMFLSRCMEALPIFPRTKARPVLRSDDGPKS